MKTSFNNGFSVKLPNGKIRSFGACQWSSDAAWEIQGMDLVKFSSRDEGFQELSRETLPKGSMVTSGYHDEERGEWEEIAGGEAVAQ
jgi:hypothetical protein